MKIVCVYIYIYIKNVIKNDFKYNKLITKKNACDQSYLITYLKILKLTLY